MNPRKAIVLKVAATLCATSMLACVKALDGRIPIGEVVFFRSSVALLPLLIWLGLQGNIITAARTRNLAGHLGRSLSGLSGMYFSYLALSYIALADATALSYAAPLFTMVLAACMLNERVQPLGWLAIAIGLGGVLVMLWPHLNAGRTNAESTVTMASILGCSFALVAALSSAASTVQIRHLNSIEQPGTIVLWFSVFATLAALSTLVSGWAMPERDQWWLLIGVGMFGGVSQMLMTVSLRYGTASLLAPLDYCTLLWSSVMGFVLLAQTPTWSTLLGGGIVAAANCLPLLSRLKPRVTNSTTAQPHRH